MNYSDLKDKYDSFREPVIEIKVGGMSLTAGASRKKNIGVSNISIDLTAGFEASQAVFSLYNVFNYERSQFNFDAVKGFVLIGSQVEIYAGYGLEVTEVFRGVITKTAFLVEEDDMANIQVTAMDVKAIMMSNRYNKRLKASTYSDAVKEIFDQNIYKSLVDNEIVKAYIVENTPDALLASPNSSENDTDKTIEMVAESDYEFVVKIAKKFNFDFFVLGGKVHFRKAKSDLTSQITIDPTVRIKSLSVEYDITGLVEEIEVRGLDVGKAKDVSKSVKNSNKISQGNKAKALINGSKMVYIDPTVSDNSEAGYRANYLFEENSYRYGSLDLEMVGLPEILPGRYITLSNMGTSVSNKFYVQSVRHIFSSDGAYTTRITGKTDRQGGGGLF